MTGAIRIVLIEDDTDLADAVALALGLEGFDVTPFGNASDALKELDSSFDGVVISDIRLPGIDGIELFGILAERDAEIPVIFTTGHGDVPMAVDLLKRGAFDFFTKPYSIAAIGRSAEQAGARRQLVLENRRLRTALHQRDSVGITGSSPAAETLRKTLQTVAEADFDVVIDGESGTGKTHCARLLHDLGPRSSRPFITIDPGLVAHQDAELILFGRDPAAGLSRTGLIERANGGTLLLDGLGRMKKSIRSRLASALETRMIQPMGAERARNLDFRVIVANRPAEEARGAKPGIESALGAIRISLPPLRDRREDIGEIFRAFLGEIESSSGNRARPIGDAEWHQLQTHDWPGNLHELRTFARACSLGLASRATPDTIHASDRPLPQILADFEKSVLEEALRKAQGSVIAAASDLQVSRKTLYDKLSRYQLRPRDYR